MIRARPTDVLSIFADDVIPDDDLQVFVPGSAGEVLPGGMSPLSWTLVGWTFGEANRIIFGSWIRALTSAEARDRQSVVRVGARLYLNASLLRTVSERLPGGSGWRAVDEQLGVTNLGLVDYQRTWRDRRRWPISAPSLAPALIALPFRQRRLRNAAHDPPFNTSGASDAALIAELARLRERLPAQMAAHQFTRMVATGAMDALGQSLLDPPRSGESPDVVSAQPALALGRLAGMIRAATRRDLLVHSVSLPAFFDEVDNSEISSAGVGFLDAFAHRGPSEYDPLEDTWGTAPELVRTVLLRLSGQPESSPADCEPSDSGLLFNATRSLVMKLTGDAEKTKDNLLRVIHHQRLVVAELANRWAEPLAGSRNLRYLTAEEVFNFAGSGLPDTAEVERRRNELIRASARIAPSKVVGGRAVSAPIVLNDDTLRGLAACGGRVLGTARVMSSPMSYFEPGDILVAKRTDVDWTPLFPLLVESSPIWVAL